MERSVREVGGDWRFVPTEGMGAAVKVTGLGCALRLAELYAEVEMPDA